MACCCVVSLPATVYGQHSPTVFSEVYLHFGFMFLFPCAQSVQMVLFLWYLGGGGVHVCTWCVSVCVCCVYVCSVCIYNYKLRSRRVFLIQQTRVILHQVVTGWQSHAI